MSVPSRRPAHRSAPSPPHNCRHAAPPRAPIDRTASTLICGVVCGITMTARHAEPPGGKRHALGMIAGARGDDAARPFDVLQVRNLVVGAAELEAEDGLQILALEQDLVLQPPRQAGRQIERRLTRHVVDAARQDVVQERRQQRVGGGGVGHGSSIVTPSRRPGPNAHDLAEIPRRAGCPGGSLEFRACSLIVSSASVARPGPAARRVTRCEPSSRQSSPLDSCRTLPLRDIVPPPRHRQPSPP